MPTELFYRKLRSKPRAFVKIHCRMPWLVCRAMWQRLSSDWITPITLRPTWNAPQTIQMQIEQNIQMGIGLGTNLPLLQSQKQLMDDRQSMESANLQGIAMALPFANIQVEDCHCKQCRISIWKPWSVLRWPVPAWRSSSSLSNPQDSAVAFQNRRNNQIKSIK